MLSADRLELDLDNAQSLLPHLKAHRPHSEETCAIGYAKLLKYTENIARGHKREAIRFTFSEAEILSRYLFQTRPAEGSALSLRHFFLRAHVHRQTREEVEFWTGVQVALIEKYFGDVSS